MWGMFRREGIQPRRPSFSAAPLCRHAAPQREAPRLAPPPCRAGVGHGSERLSTLVGSVSKLEITSNAKKLKILPSARPSFQQITGLVRLARLVIPLLSRSFSSPLRTGEPSAHHGSLRACLSRGARNICAPVACGHERGCRLLAHARHLLTQATTTARAGSSSALPSQIWRSTTLGAREQQVCLPVRVPRGHREGVTVACAHVMCCVANVAAHTSPHLLRNSHALLCSLTSAATP